MNTDEKDRESPVERARGERPHGGIEGEEAGGGSVTLTEDDVRRLNVLIAAVQLAGDGQLGCYGTIPDTTPTAVRQAWKGILEYAREAVEKVEAAHPLDRDDFLAERGETLERVVGSQAAV